jgi:hypothetical protein
MEVIATLGDFIIVIVLVSSISAGVIRLTDITSAIAYVLVIAIVSLSVWGFRARIEGRPPKETIPASLAEGRPVTGDAMPLSVNSRSKTEKSMFDETKMIKSGEYESYPLSLMRGDKITGIISSDLPVDLYIMTADDLQSFDKRKNFKAAEASKGIKRSVLNFECPRRGLWEIVLENSGVEDAEVTVLIRVLS